MSDLKPLIIVRLGADGKAEVVHSADKMKEARYWLQYIAQAGDAIFMSPSHEKYSGNGTPIYQAHLVARGKIEYNEDMWKKQVGSEGRTLELRASAPS